MADNQIQFGFYDALKCLNNFGPKESCLSSTALEIIDGLRVARKNANYVGAQYLAERVIQVCDKHGIVEERAEARVRCAVEAIKLGHLEKAAELLEAASGLYHSYENQRGLVHWMLGCVLWRIQDRENDAISAWRMSIHILDSIPKNNRFLSEEKRNQYQDWTERMRIDLKTAIDNQNLRDRDPKKDSTETENSVTSKPLKPIQSKLPREKPKIIWRNGYLVEFPVIGRIPAGTPVGVLPSYDDEGRIYQIEINDVIYLMYGINGSNARIKLRRGVKHYLLSVDGDSMNRANIENGDFVLIRQDSHPVHNDIVAAEIIGEDDRATLKRYNVGGHHRVTLRPESTNPDHITYGGELNKDFRIHGKVIAILKPETK